MAASARGLRLSVLGRRPNSKRPTTSVCHTRRHVPWRSILPTCEALLIPAGRRILANGGALSDELLADPGRCGLTLPDAIHVYRSIYRQYVQAARTGDQSTRAQLDALLHSQLGEPLSLHTARCCRASGGAQTDRVSLLLGSSVATAVPSESHGLGAFSGCWDVLEPLRRRTATRGPPNTRSIWLTSSTQA